MVRKTGHNYAGQRLSGIRSTTKIKRKYTAKGLRKTSSTTRSMTRRSK